MEDTTIQWRNRRKLTDALRRHLPDADVFGDDPRTGADFIVWNANTEAARPLARVECHRIAHVQAALRVGQECGVPLAVSGGRHDVHGRTKLDGHLILDLRPMNAVSPDAAGWVTVGGGSTTGKLLSALPEDAVAVTGWNPGVGVAGLTVGGGYGPLNGGFGLACDSLSAAQVVLADGEVVTASAAEDAELFWALRGGGTGFGVVTSLTLATYRMPRLLNAMLLFPLRSAKPALLAEQELLDEEPDRLGLLPLFTLSPDGQPALFLVMHWTGEAARGEQILRQLAACEGAQVLKQGWVPYRETLDSPEVWPWGRHGMCITHNLARLDETVAEMLVAAAGKITSPDQKLFLHDFHGAPTKVPSDATAFPLRTRHYVAAAFSGWETREEDAAPSRQAWAEEISRRLATVALPGGYVNFLPPEQGERARLFYGPSAARLRQIKRRVDPHNLFRASTGCF